MSTDPTAAPVSPAPAPPAPEPAAAGTVSTPPASESAAPNAMFAEVLTKLDKILASVERPAATAAAPVVVPAAAAEPAIAVEPSPAKPSSLSLSNAADVNLMMDALKAGAPSKPVRLNRLDLASAMQTAFTASTEASPLGSGEYELVRIPRGFIIAETGSLWQSATPAIG